MVTKTQELIGIAVNRLIQLSADEGIQEHMRKVEKYELDRNTRDGYYEDLGIEKGKELGREEGKEEAIRRTAYIMKVEGYDADAIAKVTGLTVEMIRKL